MFLANLLPFAAYFLLLSDLPTIFTSEKSGVELEPVSATLSSTLWGSRSDVRAARCIDGDVGDDKGSDGRWAICHTNKEHAPWLAIDYGTQVRVARVEIFNRRGCCGSRTRNVDVRVANQLPTSGRELFSGGTQLGSRFVGPAGNGQTITISGEARSGRYVIVQINNGGDYLNLKEVKAFGEPLDDLFEGDMKLTTKQLLAMQKGSLGPFGNFERVRTNHRNAITDKNQYWPNNIVRFELDSQLSVGEKTLVRNTLQNLQAKLNSCIRFTETNRGNRIMVTSHQAECWANVGYLGRKQELNLNSNGCMHTGIIEHEFLHAIGIHHTQGRHDRKDFIEIIDSNIVNGKEHNFNKYDTNTVTHFNLPYDYESVMHYSKTAWSKNGQITIKTRDPTKQDVIGQRNGVSDGDIDLVKRMYGCDKGCPVQQQGFLPGGNNVPGYQSVRSAGPDDCAKKCIAVDNCNGWTLFSRTNTCWLKTINKGTHFNSKWISGEPCSRSIDVTGKYFSGKYVRMAKRHNNKVAYKQLNGRFCIFFGGHWKIDGCEWMKKGDNSQGIGFTKVLDEDCPARIGLFWRYFKWGVGGFSGFNGPTSQGPIDTGIKVTCSVTP